MSSILALVINKKFAETETNDLIPDNCWHNNLFFDSYNI